MIPAAFGYTRAGSIDEALGALLAATTGRRSSRAARACCR